MSPFEAVDGRRVGGVSGVDFDPTTGQFYLLSDARGEEQEGAPRMFTARLTFEADRLAGAALLDAIALKTASGAAFAPRSIDFESIRLTPDDYSMFVASERDLDGRSSIYRVSFDGQTIGRWAAPAQLAPGEGEGVRDNLGFEAMTLARNGDVLVGVESALAQDGPTATSASGASVRLIRYRAHDGEGAPGAQFVYRTEPRAALTELLWLRGDRYLALERSFTGARPDGAAIYELDLYGASDVRDVFSLRGEDFRPARKTLLFDLRELGAPLYNIEAMSWGPRLSSGERSLIVMGDNNFERGRPTQIFAFAYDDGGSSAGGVAYSLFAAAFAAAVVAMAVFAIIRRRRAR